MRLGLLLAVAILLAAGCADPPAAGPAAPTAASPPLASPTGPVDAFPVPGSQPLPPPDPTAPGDLAWERMDFQLDARLVEGEGAASPYLVIPEGSVHVPAAGGPSPVLVFLHGRHTTCRYADSFEFLGTPCPEAPPASADVRSYAGYDYLAENLASHGYAVVSLSANDVNDRDNDYGLATGDDYGATARARMLLSLLDDLAAVEDGAGPEPLRPLAGRLDLGRIGIMGHSRGGEGVARAAVLNAAAPEPHAIRAVFALAPTDFANHVVTGPAFAVLLPYCDGDVFDLQGARMYDDARGQPGAGPLHQFVTLGANHNWYNTVWTGSDWGNRGDPHCDLDGDESGRDAPEAQRLHGLAIMAAFLRAYAGDESAFLPLLVAESPFAQPGVVVSYHPRADHARELPAGSFEGFAERESCARADCPLQPGPASATQTYLRWESEATWSIPLGGLDASAHERLALRVAADPKRDGPAPFLRVTLEDTGGHRASASLRGLFTPPGESAAKATLNMAWVPLEAFPGVDLGSLASARITFADAGAAQVADLMLQDLR